MTYKRDLEKAAERHWQAAEILYRNAKGPSVSATRSVAGYLFGIAAELAVKALMLRENPAGRSEREDGFWLHFPGLRQWIRDSQWGRHARVLQSFASDGFLQEWDIGMRYAAASECLSKPIDR